MGTASGWEDDTAPTDIPSSSSSSSSSSSFSSSSSPSSSPSSPLLLPPPPVGRKTEEVAGWRRAGGGGEGRRVYISVLYSVNVHACYAWPALPLGRCLPTSISINIRTQLINLPSLTKTEFPLKDIRQKTALIVKTVY